MRHGDKASSGVRTHDLSLTKRTPYHLAIEAQDIHTYPLYTGFFKNYLESDVLAIPTHLQFGQLHQLFRCVYTSHLPLS